MNKTALSVFVIDPFRIGGNESFARELSRQLGDYGWRSVLCFVAEPPPLVRDFLDGPNVTLESRKSLEQVSWASIKDLARLLRKHRPSILHLHFMGFLNPYPWVARLHGVKQVFYTNHGGQPEDAVIRPAPAWKRLAVRLLHAPLDRVVCVAGYGLRCFHTMGTLPPGRFVLVSNSADLERVLTAFPDAGACFRLKHGIPQDRALVVQVCWLRESKGVEDLLRAARLVLQSLPHVQFVLAGDGKDRPKFVQLAADLGISSHVCFTGNVVDPMAEGVYLAADVVCQVSRVNESFGWAVAEAMAFSRPVIGTRAGALPEVISDGVSGFIVERRDAAAIADRILLLLRDAALRREMGRAGREIAEQRFDLRKNVARLLQVYGVSR